ncbi:uncharacterized protein LOC130455436 [Monodelphis domestica]|uniref:uncharacterized protein LOC130455436 n=1 Tax=Monodelphis domestica TaxID=13616 RepID=UPI0024E1B48F|nr:uncharacterized protein LOC130455436 [Monodelphis domestica]
MITYCPKPPMTQCFHSYWHLLPNCTGLCHHNHGSEATLHHSTSHRSYFRSSLSSHSGRELASYVQDGNGGIGWTLSSGLRQGRRPSLYHHRCSSPVADPVKMAYSKSRVQRNASGQSQPVPEPASPAHLQRLRANPGSVSPSCPVERLRRLLSGPRRTAASPRTGLARPEDSHVLFPSCFNASPQGGHRPSRLHQVQSLDAYDVPGPGTKRERSCLSEALRSPEERRSLVWNVVREEVHRPGGRPLKFRLDFLLDRKQNRETRFLAALQSVNWTQLGSHLSPPSRWPPPFWGCAGASFPVSHLHPWGELLNLAWRQGLCEGNHVSGRVMRTEWQPERQGAGVPKTKLSWAPERST